jgi:hypothetical protein
MRLTILLRTVFLTLLLAFLGGGVASANVVITISKATQHMTVSVDGVQRYDWPVSTGRFGYSTPNGTFHPTRMEATYFSKEWDDAPMPHAIFFTPQGHAIHGTLDTGRLGRAASHGCIRLSPDNAAKLYQIVSAEGMGHTTVVVTGMFNFPRPFAGGSGGILPPLPKLQLPPNPFAGMFKARAN